MTREELRDKTLDLILSGKNAEVIALLTNEVLQQFNDALFYLRRGLAHKKLEMYEKAIADYDKALQIRPGYAEAFNNRAMVWDLTGEYDKAIADYTEAIKADPSDAEYFNGRGVTWDNKGEYDKAMGDYRAAINLNPLYVDAHNNMGVTWQNMKEYYKALDCYGKAIAINPSYALPYLNRGSTYDLLNEPEKMSDDYKRALEVNPGDSRAYEHIGSMLTRKGKHEQALPYFELAFKYSPFSKYYKKLLDEAKAKLGIPVTGDEEVGFSARYVENEIKELTEEERIPIRKACAIVNERVEQIRKRMVYKGTAPVVHYTQLRTADIMVMNKDARLRYSNVVFMNDPEEGKVLVDFLLDTPLKHAFEKGTLQEDNNIFLGCFLPEDKADYLVMWRTYGKNELMEEAAGCSITLHRRFFDKEDSGLYNDMRSGDIDPTERQALYHVLYYDKAKRLLVAEGNKEMVHDVSMAMKNLQHDLNTLISLKDKKDKKDESKKNMAINKFVFRYVSELRYFFKSADYQFEKELRVIKYYLPKDPAVKTDIRSEFLPRRLYIESTNPVRANIAKIILGPKVPHPERWMYLDAVMAQGGHDIELEFSRCKFQ